MTSQSAAPAQPGALQYIGQRRMGGGLYNYWACVDCKAEYPDGRCNGQPIGLCPWCREDSQPWKNGRGI